MKIVEPDQALTSRFLTKSEVGEDFERILELGRCVVAQTRKYIPCERHHLDNLEAQGESKERLQSLEHWRNSVSFTAREQAAFNLSEALTLWRPGQVSEDVLNQARRHLNPSEMVRLALAMAAVNDWIDLHESTIRVLVVEDSSADQELLRVQIQKTQLSDSVIFVSDASDALDLIMGVDGENFRRDLVTIFLDLNLPRMSGIEFLQRIRIIPDMQNFPVIVMTGSDHPQDIEECRRLKVASYVQKPVTFGALAHAIANIFHSAPAR